MIIGIGVDTATISRVEKSVSEHFLNRLFSIEEQEMFKNKRTQSVAANFAAKEAFGKAIGKGMSGFVWTDVSVLRNEHGAPYFAFNGMAKELMNGKKAHISLTHEGDFATAFVVLESEE